MVESTKNLGGAPKGNKNAEKGRLWARAIDRALAENDSKVDAFAEMVEIAKALLVKAKEGDISALKEFGDRIDGKAAQSVTIGGDEENPLVIKKARFVKPGS